MPIAFQPAADEVPEVDAATAAAAHRAKSAVFVDVREPDEWAAGHIPGATHIPLADLPERRHQLPAGNDVILVCHSGGRSYAATEFLRRTGHTRAVNMAGGMLAWAGAGFPVER